MLRDKEKCPIENRIRERGLPETKHSIEELRHFVGNIDKTAQLLRHYMAVNAGQLPQRGRGYSRQSSCGSTEHREYLGSNMRAMRKF